MRRRREFKRIWKQARSDTTFRSITQLSQMLKSRNADSRLWTLFKLRQQIDGTPPRGYFSLAKRLIDDPDNDCRWQAVIVIGEYIHTDPTNVWRVAQRYGRSEDPDMRMCVAVILLEHLLEYHFRKFFKQVKREALHSQRFADTLTSSLAFVPTKLDRNKLEKVLRQAERDHVPPIQRLPAIRQRDLDSTTTYLRND